MEFWRTSWVKVISRLWIPTVAVLAGLAVWMLYKSAPVWLESRVSNILSEKDVVVADLPISRIGATSLEVQRGSLFYRQTSLGWESVVIEYTPEQVFRGQVNRITVQAPAVGLAFELPAPGRASLVRDPVIADTADSGNKLTIEMLPRIEGDADTMGEASGPGTAVFEPPAAPAEESSSIWEQLHELPFQTLSLNNGVINLEVDPGASLSAGFEGELARQPFGMAGELFIENPDATAHFSLRVPSSQRTVTVQGGVAMPVNAVRRLGNFIIEQLEDCDTYPRIMSSGGITVDLFLEHDPTREIQGSAEANLDELTVTIADGEIELTLDDIIAAGFYRDSRFNLEGGGDVLVPKSSQLDVEPFGIHFSLRESQMIGLESEIFDWSFSGINGRCALLGGANIAEFPRPGWANIEVSFASLGYDLISADPFSLLVSHGDAGYSFQASPIGLHRSGTIWLEEVSGNAGADLADVTAGFSWYGLVGEALGSVAWMQQRQAGGMLYRLNLLDTMGAPAFEVKVVDSDDDYEIQASGALNYAWINTLLNWFDAGMFTLGGDEPLLANANLGFKDSLLSGSFDLQMDGLDVRLDSGVQIEGVNGKVDGAVMLLPRSLGKQVTRIDRISSGPVTMENILVEWELKSLRELIIYKFVAGIGDGVIELEPFSFNPLRPVFNTAVVVRKFDADLLRQWLSEKRFAIDAFIAGRIPIGWKDGQLLLGTGIFTMDTESDAGWLRFQDEQFLKEKFAAVGGVPADLKQRLLNALWENGIQMNGMELYLGATRNPDELSFRISVNGETASDLIEFPIGGFVLNNLISLEDLAILLNMVAPVRIDPDLGRD